MKLTRKQLRQRGAELDAFLYANSEELLRVARKNVESDQEANEALAIAAEKLFLSTVPQELWFSWMRRRVATHSRKVRAKNVPQKRMHPSALFKQFDEEMAMTNALKQVPDLLRTENQVFDRLEFGSLLKVATELTPDQMQVMMLATQGHSVLEISAETEHGPAEVEEILRSPLYRDSQAFISDALQTIAENTVSGLAPEVENKIDPALEVRIESIDDELIRLLANRPQMMYSLSPRKFEELLAELYTRHGFEVELTPKSKDGGCDLFVVQSTPFGRLLTVVEAKRYREDRPVGVGVVRAVFGTVNATNASAGVVATTSFFTKGAREFREQVPFRLALQDYNDLQGMIRGVKRLT